LDDPALDEVMDLCLSCKACKTECPTGVDMARLKSQWLDHRNRRGIPRRSRLIARTAALARWGSLIGPISNQVLQSRTWRGLMEWRYGLDRRVVMPRFANRSFVRRLAVGSRRNGAGRPRRVVYFVDTWTRYYLPQVGLACVVVLERLGCEVIVSPAVCCGRPQISQGLLAEARRLANRNVMWLASYAEAGVPILASEPSCLSAMLDEWPQLVRSDAARRVAATARAIESFVMEAIEEQRLATPGAASAAALYHGHCHQKALLGTTDAMRLLRWATRGRVAEINSGCCGMAGSFGHEREHYDVARAIGEQRLFPAVRGRGDAEIVVSGFSCRHQIEHHTGVPAKHVMEVTAEAMAACESGVSA